METIFLLLVGHAVADYPLQTDFMTRGKDHTAPIPGFDWWIILGMHSLIHGGAVAVVTGSWLLGLAETGVHFAIDHGRSDGRYGFRMDQALHIASKLLWALLILAGIA